MLQFNPDENFSIPTASLSTSGVLTVAAPLAAPVNTVAPVVTVNGGGAPIVGSTLTATTGTWTGNPTPTYAYQWRRNGVTIGGAIASSFSPTNSDIGTSITCRVIATNSQGSAAATSNGTTIVAAPVNTVAPVLSGLPVVGMALYVSTGTWTGSPTPTYTYQWRRNTVAIGGATVSSYGPVIADSGSTITCTVTATNSQGSASATSNGLVVSGGD